MGIDCEFRATRVDRDKALAVPGVFQVFAPGEGGCLGERNHWRIATTVRWVGEGYATDERRPRVAAMIEALRACCEGLEYGGDNAVPFVEVTDELIHEIKGTIARLEIGKCRKCDSTIPPECDVCASCADESGP